MGVGLLRLGLGAALAFSVWGCTGDQIGPRDPNSAWVGGPPQAAGSSLTGSGGMLGRSGDASSSGQAGDLGMVGTSGAGELPGSGGSAAPIGPLPGGFDAGTDPGRNAVHPGSICDRLSTIECAAEAACCVNPGRDVATCKQAEMSSCTSDIMADSIASQPAAAFDAMQAEVVFGKIEDMSSRCDPGLDAFLLSPDGVRSMFRGTVAPNKACTPTNPLDKAAAGAALAACTNADGYSCLPGLVVWNCAPHAAQGGQCFTDLNCQPGLYCDNPNLNVAGSTCKPRKTEGTACKNTNECLSLFCKGGRCVAADSQVAYCLAAQ